MSIKNRRGSLVFIICFIFLIIISTGYINKFKNTKFENEYNNVENWEEYILDVSNYKLVDNEFEMVGDDPHVEFDFSDLKENINGIRITLKKEAGPIQLYYYDDGISISEQNSIEYGIADKFEHSSISEWHTYRVDIDSDFEIQDVDIISTSLVGDFNISRYIIAYIMNFIISCLIAYINPIAVLFSELRYEEDIKKKITLFLIKTIACILVAYICEYLIVKIFDLEYVNPYRRFLIWGIIEIAIILFTFRENFIKELHLVLFSIIVILGAVNVYATPIEVGVSWDDEIHYERTLYLADGMTGNAEIQELRLIGKYANNIYQEDIYTRDDRINSLEIGNQTNINGIKYGLLKRNGVHIYSISYLPAALGIFIGKYLGFPFYIVFRMGKMFNVLFYGFIFAWAVKSIKGNGKMLCTIMALIPTNMFLTSNYAYDWWVTSLIALSFARLYNLMQKEEKISTFEYLKIIIIAFIAILPKAIYVVLFLTFMFIPSKKLENKLKCRVIAMIGMISGLCTFVLPILVNVSTGLASGDSRGGGDVNSTAQLINIFTHPFKYISVLFRFLLKYFSINEIPNYTTNMSYYGIGSFGIVVMIILLIIAIVDNPRRFVVSNKSAAIYRIVIVICGLLTVMAVATALYLDFTAVGSNTILGCQNRYLIPVLFPAFYSLFYNKLEMKANIKLWIYRILIMIMCSIYLYNLYELMITRY